MIFLSLFPSSTWRITSGHCWYCCGHRRVDYDYLLHCLLLWITCSRYVNMLTRSVWVWILCSNINQFSGQFQKCESSAVLFSATEPCHLQRKSPILPFRAKEPSPHHHESPAVPSSTTEPMQSSTDTCD